VPGTLARENWRVATRRNSDIQISWMTITYRTVAMVLIAIALATAGVIYLMAPSSRLHRSVDLCLDRVLAAVGLGTGGRGSAPLASQAHFTALDGTVRVKKATSDTWIGADFALPLDRGDVVQTGSEGMAKVFFPDGTSYTVKPDSLIVVEENSANEQQQTQVAVQVTTGTVDLSTATYSQGSSSQVIVAGATASLAPESSAMVHNDNRTDRHEILLKKGSGQVRRQNETITLSEYDEVSFHANAPTMSMTHEMGPPTLIAPANMMTMPLPTLGKSVRFSWSPSPNVRGYRIRVSRNPYFSSAVYDKEVLGSETEVPGLSEGTYFWVVTAQDASGHESAESERNQFTVLTRAPDASALLLELEPFTQHGHVIEVKGKTDPGARVMVNGQEVPLIRPDGHFSFFTPPLPAGENVVTVTAQNAKGGYKTQQKKVIID
jgi:hypothetical protein